MTRRGAGLLAACWAIVATMALSTRPGYAHKPITSPFTFDDVAPILREHCGSCHVSGGAAPMSLWTYEETLPWADSMRVELVAGHMPPSGLEGGAARFRNANVLTARELNILLTWASGGAPRGTSTSPPPIAQDVPRTWPLGEPDLKLQPAADFVMAADVQERIETFVLDPGTSEDRWIRAVDVMPGDPTIVRHASVRILSDAANEPDQLVALWLPGEAPVPAKVGTGFLLRAHERLELRVRYKKTWQRERDVVRDRSTVGVYFAEPGAVRIKEGSLVTALDSQQPVPSTFVVPTTIGVGMRVSGMQVHAVYTEPGLGGVEVRLNVLHQDGSRDVLVALRTRSDWARRYWFREPVLLAGGDRLELRARREEAALLPPGALPGASTDLKTVKVGFNWTN
jgi:hypothetical protein